MDQSTTPLLPTKIPSSKPIIIPTLQELHQKDLAFDVAKLLIKNPIFLKIKSHEFSSCPRSSKIIKRNLKYLKAVDKLQFKSPPSFYTWKLATKLQKPGVMYTFPAGKSPRPRFRVGCGIQNPQKFLETLPMKRLDTQYLNLNIFALPKLTRGNAHYLKKLQDIHALKLSNISYERARGTMFGDIGSEKTLTNLDRFTNLQSLFVEIYFQRFTPNDFYSVLQLISDKCSATLLSLKMRVMFFKIDDDEQDLTLNLPKLKYLHLHLGFLSSDAKKVKVFTSLSQLISLKRLYLEIYSGSNFSHSDVINFISAQKSLETLKFKVHVMTQEEYIHLFENVQRMEFLTKLCIVQREKYPMRFDYNCVLKTLETLEKLKALKLDLGRNGLQANEMSTLIDHLISHPSLKKLNISMKMDRMSKRVYDFDENFFAKIEKLRKKLESFKLLFMHFTESQYMEASDRISKIIIPSGRASKSFDYKAEFA